jgi:hypothetical protein
MRGWKEEQSADSPKEENINVSYIRQLEELTAEGWWNSFDKNSDEK